jgi:hypothetical protein
MTVEPATWRSNPLTKSIVASAARTALGQATDPTKSRLHWKTASSDLKDRFGILIPPKALKADRVRLRISYVPWVAKRLSQSLINSCISELDDNPVPPNARDTLWKTYPGLSQNVRL